MGRPAEEDGFSGATLARNEDNTLIRRELTGSTARLRVLGTPEAQNEKALRASSSSSEGTTTPFVDWEPDFSDWHLAK